MQFPLISNELLVILRLVHGSYNFMLMLLLGYHAFNGLQIRRARLEKTPLPLRALKLHRRMGPLLVLFVCAGFFAGLTLVLLDTGKVLQYPLHLLAGIFIVILILSLFYVSKKIAGPSILQRNLHFRLGLTLLTLYVVNVIIGIGVLL